MRRSLATNARAIVTASAINVSHCARTRMPLIRCTTDGFAKNRNTAAAPNPILSVNRRRPITTRRNATSPAATMSAPATTDS